MKYIFYIFTFLLISCEQVQQSPRELTKGVAQLETTVEEEKSPAYKGPESREDQEDQGGFRFKDQQVSFSELAPGNDSVVAKSLPTAEQEDPKSLLLNNKNISTAESQQENAYYIELNPDPNFDNTKSLQTQLDAIPDGTATGDTDILQVVGEGNDWKFEILDPEIEYVDIYLPKGKFWTEGASWKGIDPNDSKKVEGSYVTLLRGRKYLRIHGEGTTFYTKSPGIPFEGASIWKGVYSYRRHFAIWDSNNIIINGLKIEGSNYTEGAVMGDTPETTPDFWEVGKAMVGSVPGYPAYQGYWEFEHGIDLRRTSNITLKNVEVNEVWGDGIYSSDSHNIILKDCKIRWNGRMSYATNGGSNILIDGLYVERSRMSAIDFENDHPESVIEYVEVKNSKFHGVQLIGIPAQGTGDVSNINIHHNDLGFKDINVRTLTPEDLIIRKNWRINDNVNLSLVKAVWIDNLQINRNVIDSKENWVIKPSAVRNFEATGNTFLRGNGIRTAMSGAANYAPYTNERWEIRDNKPAPVIFDESDISSESGKALYEQMKAVNPSNL